MIILDEELQGLGLEGAMARWYRGAVIIIKQLRPGTVIKDEAIPALLRAVKQPTFVTINHTDFWRRIPAETAYCLVCVKLTADQAAEIPDLLRRLFRLPEFKTKGARMGKVALVSRRVIQYYFLTLWFVSLHLGGASQPSRDSVLLHPRKPDAHLGVVARVRRTFRTSGGFANVVQSAS